MIPASSFLLDGDTAIVVYQPGVDPMFRWKQAIRPCGTCGGCEYHPHHRMEWHDVTCVDCDGTGRHTFDIETPGEYGGISDDGPGPHEMLRFRVHVIDVLPIVDWFAGGDMPWPCVEMNPDHADSIPWTPRTPPPDAAPGKWLIRLAVHQ